MKRRRRTTVKECTSQDRNKKARNKARERKKERTNEELTKGSEEN
jgi:hypothetical protein